MSQSSVVSSCQNADVSCTCAVHGGAPEGPISQLQRDLTAITPRFVRQPSPAELKPTKRPGPPPLPLTLRPPDSGPLHPTAAIDNFITHSLQNFFLAGYLLCDCHTFQS